MIIRQLIKLFPTHTNCGWMAGDQKKQSRWCSCGGMSKPKSELVANCHIHELYEYIFIHPWNTKWAGSGATLLHTLVIIQGAFIDWFVDEWMVFNSDVAYRIILPGIGIAIPKPRLFKFLPGYLIPIFNNTGYRNWKIPRFFIITK